MSWNLVYKNFTSKVGFKVYLIFGVILIFGLIPFLKAEAITDGDNDGIDDSTENAMILKFAPKLYLDVNEDNLLSSVDWYLQRVTMRFNHDGGCSDDEILSLGNVNQTAIYQQVHDTKNWYCSHNDDNIHSDQYRDVAADEGFFLQPPNTNNYDSTVHLGDSNSANWKVYAHFRNSSTLSGGYDIQYWFFYPYNDSPSVAGVDLNHEGDWEHITVTLDSNMNLYSAYYAAHNNEGQWYSPSLIQFADRYGNLASASQELQGDFTHPIVYSAVGTHASYPTAGQQPRNNLPDDYTSAGMAWNSYNGVVNVGEKGHVLNNQSFIRYAGLWGEIGETSVSTGPPGPAFQSAWDQY